MANGFDYTRLKRLIIAYYIVQGLLIALLASIAVWLRHMPQHLFISSLTRAIMAQVMIAYPVYRFASHEAKQEAYSCNVLLSSDEVETLQHNRVTGDIVTAVVFTFFLLFTLGAPQLPGVRLCILLLFILMALCYLQCYNFVAKQQMKANAR